MSLAFGLALLTASVPAAQDASTAFQERMVEVEKGRSLFLRCVGSGPVTVLFDAGGSDWSIIWAQLQRAIGDRVQACAYDRAGLGKSPAARGPRTPAAIAGDIHSLIAAADFKRPVVLVGHSLGGFNVKLAAALFPDDVAGLVLIDPAEERTWERSRDRLARKYGERPTAQAELADRSFFPALVENYEKCVRIAASTGLAAGSNDYRRCADPDRPALGKEANEERQKVQGTLGYQQTQASEIRWCVYADPGSDAVYARLFRRGALGSKPMVVLTHLEEPSQDPVDRVNAEQGILLHKETAALSSRGVHQEVSGSGHYIQLDRPDVVIAAVDRVVAQVRK